MSRTYAKGYQDALGEIKAKIDAEGLEAAMQYINDNLRVGQESATVVDNVPTTT